MGRICELAVGNRKAYFAAGGKAQLTHISVTPEQVKLAGKRKDTIVKSVQETLHTLGILDAQLSKQLQYVLL